MLSKRKMRKATFSMFRSNRVVLVNQGLKLWSKSGPLLESADPLYR